MSKLIMKGETSQLRDSYIANNTNNIELINFLLEQYVSSTGVKLATEEIAPQLTFLLATLENRPLPIQTVAGQLIGLLTRSDKLEVRVQAMATALDILCNLDPLVVQSTSFGGFPMVQSMIVDSEYSFKAMYPFPQKFPQPIHKSLGNYNWRLNEHKALDILNEIPLTLINLEEEPPTMEDEEGNTVAIPEGDERYEKYIIRQLIKEDMKDGRPFFINWHSCYRGRMYAGGYHINPQGNEEEKNMVVFHKGEKLNFAGKQQLKRSLVATYGNTSKREHELIDEEIAQAQAELEALL